MKLAYTVLQALVEFYGLVTLFHGKMKRRRNQKYSNTNLPVIGGQDGRLSMHVKHVQVYAGNLGS